MQTKGLLRIIKAAGYSLAGIKAALVNEAAFRQELFLAGVLMPAGLFMGETGIEKALLILPLIMVLVAELLNSSIEAAVDRMGKKYHPLAKQAKDMGSAAVFVSLAAVVLIWTLILI